MEFGSKYVYNYSDSEEEDVSEEEIEMGLKKQKLKAAAASVSSNDKEQSKKSKGEKQRRADTNVVVITFDRLTTPSDMHTGEPVYCVGCRATLSHISEICETEKEKIWICEFCDAKNVVDLTKEEKPNDEDVTYMLEPAAAAAASEAAVSNAVSADESIVVFCVDYSGSMEAVVATTPDNKSITRLQGVKRAVHFQLQQLVETQPNCRVAIVAFESEVVVLADGKSIKENHQVRDLYDKSHLLSVAGQLHMPAKITDSQNTLSMNLLQHGRSGSTALGPGLLVSISLARQHPGSKVIICTDGEANVGVGSLSDQSAASAFYTEAAEIAREGGVSVSVLTIAGTECKLVELGRVADLTGGQVNIVDPMKISDEFGNILSEPIIATQVTARFLVHRGLYILGLSDKLSQTSKDVGNVTSESEITFQYGIKHSEKKPKKEEETKPEGSASSDATASTSATTSPPTELPFQVQITYRDRNGAKALRVLTQKKPVTKDRQMAEANINMPIVGAHAIHQTTMMAVQGQYTHSRLQGYGFQKMMFRNVNSAEAKAGYEGYEACQAALSDDILNNERREANMRGISVGMNHGQFAQLSSDQVREMRSKECSDSTANNMYNIKKKGNSRAFKK